MEREIRVWGEQPDQCMCPPFLHLIALGWTGTFSRSYPWVLSAALDFHSRDCVRSVHLMHGLIEISPLLLFGLETLTLISSLHPHPSCRFRSQGSRPCLRQQYVRCPP